jgi:hypothetical protein
MIAPELLQAYRATIYTVRAASSAIAFQVDRPAPEIARLMADSGCTCAAFVTAFNPASRPQTGRSNDEAAARLRRAADAHGWRWLAGEGRDPSGHWPPEQSLLILGIEEREAVDLARQFGQNAIVFIEAGEPPRLVIAAS